MKKVLNYISVTFGICQKQNKADIYNISLTPPIECYFCTQCHAWYQCKNGFLKHYACKRLLHQRVVTLHKGSGPSGSIEGNISYFLHLPLCEGHKQHDLGKFQLPITPVQIESRNELYDLVIRIGESILDMQIAPGEAYKRHTVTSSAPIGVRKMVRMISELGNESREADDLLCEEPVDIIIIDGPSLSPEEGSNMMQTGNFSQHDILRHLEERHNG
ncbi:hypothetical protein BKA93DRAFT_753587 [Sparassis latifolia]